MTLISVSIRYAVLLVPEPAFTSRAYRARQIICGQYGSWAAEMLMVHLMLSRFFPCPDDHLPELTAGLDAIASDSREAAPGFPMCHHGVASLEDAPGTIFLDFTPQEPDHPLLTLHARVAGLVNGVADGPDDAVSTETETRIYLPLMQYADLPETIFADAVEFAGSVVENLATPSGANAWRLMLARFQSQSAGESWDQGGWANDVSWKLLASFPL
jgi:hypothetical protein